MPSLEQNEKAVQNLISRANNKTGKTNTDLTSAVNSLLAGYGQGGSGNGVPIAITSAEEVNAIMANPAENVGKIYNYAGTLFTVAKESGA